MAAYRPFQEDIMHAQEHGMEAFVEMENRMVNAMRWSDLRHRGKKALDLLKCSDDEGGIVLLAIDFEGGNDGPDSITECGLASFSGTEFSITTTEFAVKRHPRKSRFSEPVLTNSSLLRGQITRTVERLHERYKSNHIVLVGQSIFNEIRILGSLDIEMEDLPIYGLLDTHNLAWEILGAGLSLGKLLTALRIPSCPEAFHCAGNDAHFTLQALLGSLSLQDDRYAGRWDHITKKSLPQPQCWHEEEGADWDAHLSGAIETLHFAA